MSGFYEFWEILGIEATNDKNEIKQAYAKQSKLFHPEEKPEQFKKIQEAYQFALAYAKAHKNSSSKEIKKYSQEHNEFSNDLVNKKSEYQEFLIKDSEQKSDFTHSVTEIIIGDPTKKSCKQQKYDNSKMTVGDFESQNSDQIKQQKFTYQLGKIENLIRSDPHAITLDKIFSSRIINEYLKDPLFKNKLENILVETLHLFPNNALEYIEILAKRNEFERLQTKTKRKKARSNQKAMSPFVIGLVVLVLSLQTLSTNSPKNKDPLLPTVSYDPMQFKYDSDFILNKRLLHGVRVEYKESEFYILNEDSELLISEKISFVKYTQTHLLLLEIENQYYIYNTETQTLHDKSYPMGNVYHVKEGDITHLKDRIVVFGQDNQGYLIDFDGVTELEIMIENIDGEYLYLEEENYILR